MNTTWMPDMDAQISQHLSDGVSLTKVADMLGISRNIVTKRRDALGIVTLSVSEKIWTAEVDARIVAMARERVNVREQAKMLGVSPAALAVRRKKLGLGCGNSVWTKADSERAAILYAQGLNFRAIGAELGFHGNTVADHLEADGLYNPHAIVEKRFIPVEATKAAKTHVEFGDFLIAKKAVSRDTYGVAFPVPVSVSAGVERRA